MKQRWVLAKDLYPEDTESIDHMDQDDILDYLNMKLDLHLYGPDPAKRDVDSDATTADHDKLYYIAPLNTTTTTDVAADADSDVNDFDVQPYNASIHRHTFQRRKVTRVNCRALCHSGSAVYNECACQAVCHHGIDEDDCKEAIHRMGKLYKLTRCLWPSAKAEKIFQSCAQTKHRHDCFQKLFNAEWSAMTPGDHSHPGNGCYEDVDPAWHNRGNDN